MRRNASKVTWVLLGLVPASIAWTAVAPRLELQPPPQSRLWVDGTSTVRSFQCTAAALEADVQTTTGGAVNAVLSGDKAVSAVTFSVPAAQLDCKNGTMNGHMLKALKATEHPAITFTLSSYEIASAASGINGKVNGTLNLGGVKKPITLEGTAVDENGMLRIAGTHELLMTDYGLKPPSLMMGTMKVAPKVKVGFDLLLK